MKKLILIFGIALMPFSSYGTMHDSQMANVRTWLLRLQEDPRKTAEEFGEWWFAVAHLADWSKHYQIELVALELVAYYAELEKALATNGAPPLHEEQVVHDPFYHARLKPDGHTFYFENELFGARAHQFARALLKDLFEREDAANLLEEEKTKGRGAIARKPTAAKLIARILRDGRGFWFDHVLTEILRRRPPITEELQMYARVLPDFGYERFLAAIMDHQYDFRGSQPVVEDLVGTRLENLQDVPRTGNARCDLMLELALRNHQR